MAYTLLGEIALGAAWSSPLFWPAYRPHDPVPFGCAALALLVGLTAFTARGPGDAER